MNNIQCITLVVLWGYTLVHNFVSDVKGSGARILCL